MTSTGKLLWKIIMKYSIKTILSLLVICISVSHCDKVSISNFCINSLCQNVVINPNDYLDAQYMNLSAESLLFVNSSIPKVPDNIFEIFMELKQLSFEDCQTELLSNSWSSSTLEVLYIVNNKIKTIGISGLSSFPNLKYLWLNNNEINSLSKNQFTNLGNLLWIELSYNQIVELPKEIFNETRKLTSLFLTHNRIEKLQVGLFDNCPKLYHLDLKFNNLKIIEDGIFRNIKSLWILDISFNPIKNLTITGKKFGVLTAIETSLTNLKIKGQLTTLYMTQTPIKNLNIYKSKIIENLVVHNGSLSDLNNFEEFENLKYMDVSGNPLNFLNNYSFFQMKRLQVLYLKNCNLTTLPIGLFEVLNNLTKLDIRDNLIQNFDIDVLKPAVNLQNIFLGGNPWNCSSLEELLKYLDANSISYSGSYKETGEDNNVSGIYCNNQHFDYSE